VELCCNEVIKSVFDKDDTAKKKKITPRAGIPKSQKIEPKAYLVDRATVVTLPSETGIPCLRKLSCSWRLCERRSPLGV